VVRWVDVVQQEVADVVANGAAFPANAYF